MKQFIITNMEENQRIDKYILKILCKSSKSFIYKMFRKKNIKLNDNKILGNEILKSGDKINIYFSDETFDKFINNTGQQLNNKISFEVIYEDYNILICNKPVGLLSQPDGKHDNLVNQIENYFVKTCDYNKNNTGFRPGICNRLDRNTSGIVISGKNIKTLQNINKAILNKEVDKIYHAIIVGNIKEEKAIIGYLQKDIKNNKVFISKQKNSGHRIETIYRPIKNNDKYTLLEVKIMTGKSHQIRAHLCSIGHPIVGDPKYGDFKVNKYFYNKYKLDFQLLHAYKYKIFGREYIAKYNDKFEYIYNDLF